MCIYIYLHNNHHHTVIFFLMMSTFKIYCLSNFQICITILLTMGFPGDTVVKNPPVGAGDGKRTGLVPGLGKFPWSRKWQLTPVFWPGKLHGQGSLGGHSPWSCRVRHNWARAHTHTHTHTHIVNYRLPYYTLCVLLAQSFPTLYDPSSLPGSCTHGILQARILEWIAISFSRYYT